MRRFCILILKIFLALFLAVSAVFIALVDIYGINLVSADTEAYSDVLDDLHIDSSFNESDYPVIAGDSSLRVIQIAESSAGELFIYIYQPGELNLIPNKISISTTTGDTLSPYVYNLSLLNSSGVFYKFLVEEFTVKTDLVRYYEIIEMWRPWNEVIDKGSGNDNIIDNVPVTVAQLWMSTTVDNEVIYQMTETEVQEIKTGDRWDDFLRYSSGFKLCQFEKVDSHYIAFSTEKKINKLVEAEVYYVTRTASATFVSNIQQSVTYGDPVENYAKLFDSNEVTVSGLFGKTYSWNRIESVSDFIANENLKDEAKKNLSGKQWILRFAETEYTTIAGGNLMNISSVEVSQVTVLSLTFEVNGVTYKMGVVSDMRSSDDVPGNKQVVDEILDWVKNIFSIICLVLFVIAIAVVFPPFISVVKFIFKGLAFVIALPFKLIRKIFK